MAKTETCILQTADIDAAATLRASGVELLGLRDERGKIIFSFNDTGGKASQVLERHRTGALKIPSLILFAALSSVKDDLFSYRRSSGLDRDWRATR